MQWKVNFNTMSSTHSKVSLKNTTTWNSPLIFSRGFAAVKIKTLSLSPSGFGIVGRELMIPKGASQIDMQAPVQSIHSTLWVSPQQEVESMKVIETSEIEDKECATNAEILQANTESVIEIQVGSEWIAGRIVAIQQQAGVEGLVLIQGESSVRVIGLSKINSVRVPIHPPPKLSGGELKEQRILHRLKIKSKKKTLRINLKNAPVENKPLRIGYVTRGMAWTPSYILSLSNSESGTLEPEANLQLNCIVMNDMEDVKIDQLTCTTKDPSFKYAEIRDTLIPKTLNIENFFSNLSKTNLGIPIPPPPVASPSPTSPLPPPPSPVSGKPLFPPSTEKMGTTLSPEPQKFEFSNISLTLNDRVTLPAFEVTAPIRSIYHVHLIPDQNHLVFSALHLNNQSEFDWPAGPVTVTNSNTGEYISQSDLSATQMKKSSLVDLQPETRIILRTNQSKQAVDEKKEQVTVSGSILNNKEKEVTVFVTRQVSGQVTESSSGAQMVVVDGITLLTWELKISPNQSKDVSFSYLQSIQN